MRMIRMTAIAVLIATTACAGYAQKEMRIAGMAEYLEALEYPQTLSLKLTGVFRSLDFQTYRQMTVDPFADLSVVGRWALVKGERYDYELSLAADGDWRLRSLALNVLGQGASRATTDATAGEMSLKGAFIATSGGMMCPHYAAEGEAERDVTVQVAPVALPDPSRFHPVETDDPRLKLARLDVREFIEAAQALGGEGVLTIDAPEGSTVELWTVGNPEKAVTLPVGERVGTHALPPAPWALRITLPEGMTVDDLPDGRVGLDLNAEGILPDWLNRGPNPVE